VLAAACLPVDHRSARSPTASSHPLFLITNIQPKERFIMSNPAIDKTIQDVVNLEGLIESWADAHAKWAIDAATVDALRNQAPLDIAAARARADHDIALIQAAGDKAIADAQAALDAAKQKAVGDLQVAKAKGDAAVAQATADANKAITDAQAVADASNAAQEKAHAAERFGVSIVKTDASYPSHINTPV